QGDRLIVAINSDASVRELKGPGRPIYSALDRRNMLQALGCVDEVVIFDDELSLLDIIRRLRPDVLVKGGEYVGTKVPGAEYARHVWFAPMKPGYSTTGLIERIRRAGSA